MTLYNFNKLANKLAQQLSDSEQLATGLILSKLKKCAEAYPQDKTIVAMSAVLDEVSENKPFITRADFKNYYNKFFSRNTKFAQLFTEELGYSPSQQNVEPKKTNLRDNCETTFVDAVNVTADSFLSNALSTVFEKHQPAKLYDKTLAEKSALNVSKQLKEIGAKASNIGVDNGSDKFIIIRADYQTPKGITSIFVPVEILNEKVSEASVFMGNKGPEDLTKDNIVNYVRANAGKNLLVKSATVLQALENSVSTKQELDAVDLALLNKKAKESNQLSFNSQIINQTIETPVDELKIARLEEADGLEQKLSSDIGKAISSFGRQLVTTSHDVVRRELTSIGCVNPQISVAKCDNAGMYFAVKANGGQLAFVVPVKIANNKIMTPSYLVSNGSIMSLSKESINELIIENNVDYKAASIASPLHGLTNGQLLSAVKEAIQEQNYVKAEDALNVIKQNGDVELFAKAFNLYTNSLSNKTASTEQVHKCSMQVNRNSSKHTLCGHTGLPLHKVAVDQYGNCSPKGREAMPSSKESGFFMNYKVFI